MNRKILLNWVDPVDLHDHWDTIKEGLEKVRKAGDHWLAEDVYKSIKDGHSNLHLGLIDGDYSGFLITQQQMGYDGVFLHIWACYSTERKEAHLLETAFPTIEEWARNIKAKRITFSSNRPGWKRNKLGFVPTVTTYERRIS